MRHLPLEGLENRTLLTATLDNGVLTIVGTDNAETITVNDNGAGQFLANDGAAETPFPAADVNSISIDALGGDDTITVNVNRPTTIMGGAGLDTITGSDGGNDSVIGQTGNDTVTLRGGDDVFVWNPGDGSDMVDGNDGSDTLEFNGSGAAEVFEITPLPNDRVNFFRNVGNINMNMGTTEHFVVDAMGGNDTLTGNTGLAGLIDLNFDAGDGDDSMSGTDGADTFVGGAGNDTVDGNRGNDTALLGDDDDLFIWDPGDGSDIVEGDAGNDELQFNGAGADEIFEVSPNGSRVRFTRNVGNIVMDLNAVERIDVAALGGADQVSVRDTAGTGLQQFNIELEGAVGGDLPDETLDTVTVFGSSGADVIVLTGNQADGITINGTSAVVTITNEDASDALIIDARGGSDVIDATAIPATTVRLTLTGNTGHDTLLGSDDTDTFFGGAGNDVIDGNRGNDTANMDAGNDTFIWDPGDGSDIVEGGADFDTLRFNGSGGNEVMEASANGSRLRFTRDVGSINMDVNGTEKLDVRAMGGDDTVTIGDLGTTDTSQVFVDGGDGNDVLTGGPERDTFVGGAGEDVLRGNSGIDVLNGGNASSDDNESDRVLGGSSNDFLTFGDGDRFDGQNGNDSLIFNATNRSDQITVDFQTIGDLPRAIFVTNRGSFSAVFSNGEIIQVNAGSGNDTVVMSQAAGTIWRANFLGGSGHDLLVGGNLDDVLRGETGNDTLVGLGGTDDLDGGTARNLVIQ